MSNEADLLNPNTCPLPGQVVSTSGFDENLNCGLILEALKLNWEHARHVEKQRNTLALAYAGAMLAAGAVALEKDNLPINIGASIAGVFVTLLCWGMTHKWNLAFATQIQKADLCAKALTIVKSGGVGVSALLLHSFIGFPRRDPNLRWLNIRLLFDILYGVTSLFWILFLAFKVYRAFAH